MAHLLDASDNLFGIVIHSDPLSTIPAALSKKRAFKKSFVQYDELHDEGGARKCPFCNTELLDGHPTITYHCEKRVMSFPNAAPFLPGDQRVLCLWHEDEAIRYSRIHKYKFEEFGIEEFYYMLSAAVELAGQFPQTHAAKSLQKDLHLIRCIAGFNVGRLAGQSIPHFHMQYGWDVYLKRKGITPELLALFYAELWEEGLILHEDDVCYVVAPWTPKGQYHLEIHFRDKFELAQLTPADISMISYVARHIMVLYGKKNIRNVNILFVGSPYGKTSQPLILHFIPRVNMTALYEMIGVNVVDTFPEDIANFFQQGFRWSDVVHEARKFDIQESYMERIGDVARSQEGAQTAAGQR